MRHKETSSAEYPTFYVDDSACEIDGRKHVILAAIAFTNDAEAIANWFDKKREHQMHPFDEIKWNNKSIRLEDRRAFVPLLNNGLGIVVVDDGGKQAAAERLSTQVWQYCHDQGKNGFRLRFDRDIVEDRKRLKAHLGGLYPPCVGLSEHDSEVEQLIQYADFLAGTIKLKLDFGLGNRDPNSKIVIAGEGGGPNVEMEQSFYFFAALRYCLWGRVHDFGDDLIPYPKKMVMDKGVVIVSSASSSTVAKAVSFIDGDYMGCIH
jgi:hypothetical protein